MNIVEQSELSDEQKKRIIEMWNAEYPASLMHAGIQSFDDYLNGLGDKKHFLLMDEAGGIIGWAITFERAAARWFAIIIDGRAQGKGFGVKLLDHLKASEETLFGWVIDTDGYRKANGESYRSPLGFYKKIGFKVFEDEKLIKQEISGVKIEWRAAKD